VPERAREIFLDEGGYEQNFEREPRFGVERRVREDIRKGRL
jgi:hypothetical protein